MPTLAVLATIVGPICLLVAWLAFLRFSRWLVTHTGDPSSLEHAAALARAVRKQADVSTEPVAVEEAKPPPV